MIMNRWILIVGATPDRCGFAHPLFSKTDGFQSGEGSASGSPCGLQVHTKSMDSKGGGRHHTYIGFASQLNPPCRASRTSQTSQASQNKQANQAMSLAILRVIRLVRVFRIFSCPDTQKAYKYWVELSKPPCGSWDF